MIRYTAALTAALLAGPALAQTDAPASIQVGPADAPIVQIQIPPIAIPRIEVTQPQPDPIVVPAPVDAPAVIVADPAAPIPSGVPADPAAPTVSATVAETVPDETIEKLSYTCAGGGTMQVVYVNTSLGNSWAIVLDRDQMIPMTISPSASGAIYKATGPDTSHELLTKGDTASLIVTTGGREETVMADCVAH